MRESRWMVVCAGAVIAVVVGSVLLGLSYPDGRINRPERSVSSQPTPLPPVASPTPDAAPSADRAPDRVAGVWPGRPAATTLTNGTVDWCPAVSVDASALAREVAGDEVRDVACEAVRYMFDGRLTRLAIPQRTYALEDFDYLRPYFDTTSFERGVVPLLRSFVGDPERHDISRLLSIFRGEATRGGAKHARAGHGRIFYGPAFTSKGYRGRAVWINPQWSPVKVTASGELLEVEFSASAAVPVFSPAANRDDMMVVASSVFLQYGRSDSGQWLIRSGSGTYAEPTFKPLRVRG